MERLYIVKMSILPKLFYRMNVIQINIPEELHRIDDFVEELKQL